MARIPAKLNSGAIRTPQDAASKGRMKLKSRLAHQVASETNWAFPSVEAGQTKDASPADFPPAPQPGRTWDGPLPWA